MEEKKSTAVKDNTLHIVVDDQKLHLSWIVVPGQWIGLKYLRVCAHVSVLLVSIKVLVTLLFLTTRRSLSHNINVLVTECRNGNNELCVHSDRKNYPVGDETMLRDSSCLQKISFRGGV